MSKKIVRIIIILMSVLFISCGKEKDSAPSESNSSQENSTKTESDSNEAKEELICYDYSVYSEFAFKGLAKGAANNKIKLDKETADKLKNILENEEWQDSKQDGEDLLENTWIDCEFVLAGSDVKYYISLSPSVSFVFSERRPIVIRTSSTETAKVLGFSDEMEALYKSIVKTDASADLMTEEESISYAVKCIAAYAKMEEAAGRKSGFTTNDNPEKYTFYVNYPTDVELGTYDIELLYISVLNPDNPGECFNLALDRELKAVVSGHHFSFDPEKYTLPEKVSYEGLELSASYFEETGFGYSDRHFDYSYSISEADNEVIFSVTPVRNPETKEDYKPQPVENVEEDAGNYFAKLYPEYLNEKEDWEVAVNDKKNSIIVAYKNNTDGQENMYASFVYLKTSDGETSLWYAKLVGIELTA